MIARLLVFSLAAAAAFCGAARGAEVQVKLVNQSAEGFMAFDPPLVKIKPGDSVKFVAADQGHTAESIEGMAPDGAKSAQTNPEAKKRFDADFAKLGG